MTRFGRSSVGSLHVAVWGIVDCVVHGSDKLRGRVENKTDDSFVLHRVSATATTVSGSVVFNYSTRVREDN